MSRSASISLEFVANLDPARAKYESFVKEIQSKPISVPVTVGGGQNQPTTAEAATFGSPGGRITGSISTPASNRLDMLTFKPFSGGAPPGPLGMQGGGGGAGGGMPWGAASANWSYLLAQQSQQIVGGLTPTSSPNWSYFMGQRGGGGGGGGMSHHMQMMMAKGVGMFALSAVHELTQMGQSQLDYNALLAGSGVYAGADPIRQAQARTEILQASQQLAQTRASSFMGIIGGGLGTIAGSMIAPGVGTMIGAGIGTALGQGVGKLGYSALSGEDDARALAQSRRSAESETAAREYRDRAFAAQQSNQVIGTTGAGTGLQKIANREAALTREYEQVVEKETPSWMEGSAEQIAERRRQMVAVGKTPSNAAYYIDSSGRSSYRTSAIVELEKAQQEERKGLGEQNYVLGQQLATQYTGLTSGSKYGRLQEIEHEIKNIALQYGPSSSKETNDNVTQAVWNLRRERMNLNLDLAADRAQGADSVGSAYYGLTRNQFGADASRFSADNARIMAMQASPEDRARLFGQNALRFGATAQVIRRQNVEASYDIERGNLAARQLREGYGLESSLTRIETNRQQQLREIGGTGSSILDRLFGFTRRREAVNAGAGEQITAARQDEARRVIGVQGGIRAGQYGLHDQPLNAQLTEINTRYDQLREGVTNPQRLAELGRSQAVELLQAQQQFNNQTKLINIGQKYTSLSLDRLFAWDATGAQADTIAGQSIMQANQYAFSGRPGQAEAERGIGLKNLQLLKRNYLAGFEGGAEIDPWSVRRAPRDFTDPVATLDEIAKRQQDLKNAKFGSDPAEVPDILKRIEGMFGGLVANIMSMATAQ